MKITALLTGRGNNTLPDKNVREILGHPVLHYPAIAGREASYVTDWYCSSDDEKILAAAEQEGYQRILRPEELARPDSQHIDCILHALNVMEQKGQLPDILVVLLANNITVHSSWVDDCIRMLIENPHASAVVPVYQDNDHHPLRAKSLAADGYLKMYEKDAADAVSTNRQDLPSCMFLAHNFWVLRTSVVRSPGGQPPWTFMGDFILPYKIDRSIDIHDELDLHIAKAWLEMQEQDVR